MDEKITFEKDNKEVKTPRIYKEMFSYFFHHVKSKLNRQVAEKSIQK